MGVGVGAWVQGRCEWVWVCGWVGGCGCVQCAECVCVCVCVYIHAHVSIYVNHNVVHLHAQPRLPLIHNTNLQTLILLVNRHDPPMKGLMYTFCRQAVHGGT